MNRPSPSLGLGDVPSESLEGELSRFFGYSHDVLAIMDGGGRVLMISPSVERVLGYPTKEIVGRHFLHWLHPDDKPLVRTQTRTLLKGRPIADLDARIFRADGVSVPMRWSLSVGPGRRIYAVGRDRTDEAQRQESLLRQELAELRLRTTMELHDGVLQTLTGASLQIEVARRLLRRDPDAAEQVLHAVGEGIGAEQREIRLYVDEVKGHAPSWTDGSLALPDRIETILERVGMIWGVEISVDARVTEGVPAELGRQILRIIQESTVNAARHGAAKSVSVAVALDGPEITITIVDNGTGFSFLGEYDHKALKEKRLGPLSLKHRVEEAEGSICINSAPGRSTIVVRLPLSQERGA